MRQPLFVRSQAVIVVCACCVWLTGAAAYAGPIYPTVSGCVPLQPGRAEWYSPEYFSFATYWDLEAGCEPTVAIPTQMYTRDILENGWYRVTVSSDMLPPCGRGQFDAASMWDEWHTWVIVDTGINCADFLPPAPPPPPEEPPPPPPVFPPPSEPDVPTTVLPPDSPPDSPPGPAPPDGEETPPNVPDVPTGIPEPASVLLLSSGLGVALVRRSRRSKR
jgi:hypothetical protein